MEANEIPVPRRRRSFMERHGYWVTMVPVFLTTMLIISYASESDFGADDVAVPFVVISTLGLRNAWQNWKVDRLHVTTDGVASPDWFGRQTAMAW
jgi:hypothetical protein